MRCVDGALIVVDTSHLTFLARGAVALMGSAGTTVLDVFHRLTRAVGCWSDRLRTSPTVLNDQIGCDPDDSVIHAVLGEFDIPDELQWLSFIQTSEEPLTDSYSERAAVAGDESEPHDLELIGYGIALAHSNDIYLVSNDERLLRTARSLVDRLRKAGESPPRVFAPIDSVGLMKRMLDCAGIDREIMEVLLVTEYEDVNNREMSRITRLKKVRRLESTGRELSISVQPAHIPPDDAELRALFMQSEESDSE